MAGFGGQSPLKHSPAIAFFVLRNEMKEEATAGFFFVYLFITVY